MAAVTRLRPIWKRLAVEHEATVLLHKRLDFCTSGELEQLVQQVKTGLKHTTGKWKLVRSLNLPDVVEPYLVPGGRWLLNQPGWPRSSILYADLENPDATWRTLIPMYDAGIEYALTSYEHIVGAPTLTLHIAFAIGRSFLPSETAEPVNRRRTDVQEISVWRVSPTFDDQGLIDGLQADRICHFRHAPGAKLLAFLRIQGDRLLFLLDSPAFTCTVLRWAEANSRVDYPRQIVYHSGCRVRLFCFMWPSFC